MRKGYGGKEEKDEDEDSVYDYINILLYIVMLVRTLHCTFMNYCINYFIFFFQLFYKLFHISYIILCSMISADWTFLEAPQSEEEMVRYCTEVDGPKLANMLEGGRTPVLSPKRLQEIGYTVAAYPLTLLSASVKSMQSSLQLLKEGKPVDYLILPFTELQDVVGFTEYNNDAEMYKN